MRDFEHCTNVLKLILIDRMPFRVAVTSSLKKDKRQTPELKSLVTATVGGVLRHYYSLKRTVDSFASDLEEENKIVLMTLLSNRLFSKRIDEIKFLSYCKKDLGLKTADEYLAKYQDFTSLLPTDEIPFGSDEYFHLKDNIPLWVVKMWKRNAGDVLSKKLLRDFNKRNGLVLRVDNGIISDEEFIKKYSDYSSLNVPGLVSLTKNVNSNELEPLKNKDALKIHGGYSYLINKLDVDFIRGVAVYSGCSNDILDELYARFGSSIKFEYLCGNQSIFFANKKKADRYVLPNVSFYECQYSSILTCISKPVHTFFLSPENTSFQRLLEESDYFLNISQEQLDEFIKIQKETLDEVSSLVDDGGRIIYVIPTLCRNETYGLVKDFLKRHEDFYLEEETQLLPIDKYKSMLYYAILVKGEKHD